MNILQVSTVDHGGGAAKVPWDLYGAYRRLGHRSMLAIGYHRGAAPIGTAVFEIPNNRLRSRWSQCLYALPTFLQRRHWRGETWLRNRLVAIAEPHRAKLRILGFEDFDYPASRKLLELAPAKPDIIHCHNLHGDYFDLRTLVDLSAQVPVILTLHDMWTFTGHCAYSIECEGWGTGCGHCPDLNLYPAIARDATAENWRIKENIYARSRLYVSAPCQWLIDNAQASMLRALNYRVIPYGLDLEIFRPAERLEIRQALGWPLESRVLLFVASRAQENRYKDYSTIAAAMERTEAKLSNENVMYVTLGGREDKTTRIGGCELRQYAFRFRQEEVAQFYQAADVFLHAANADTFPNTVLEAQACGVPVVATAVGGIPEQVQEGVTGYLVARGDVDAMTRRVTQLLEDETLRRHMAVAAVTMAQQRFDLNRQVSDYLSWYEEILGRGTKVSMG